MPTSPCLAASEVASHKARAAHSCANKGQGHQLKPNPNELQDLTVGLFKGFDSVEEATEHGQGGKGTLPYLWLTVSQKNL